MRRRSEKQKKNGRVLTFETMRAPERLTAQQQKKDPKMDVAPRLTKWTAQLMGWPPPPFQWLLKRRRCCGNVTLWLRKNI